MERVNAIKSKKQKEAPCDHVTPSARLISLTVTFVFNVYTFGRKMRVIYIN